MLNNFMAAALERAKNINDDIPVVALIVKDNEIISIECNEREKNNKTTHHAEILAIERANEKLNNWRLDGCDIYITLEPCPMCAWAILNARIKNVYFGSYDTNYGAFGSKINLANIYNTNIDIKGGIMEKECDELLKNYFRKLRNEKETR